jgi:hypothetical protein
MLKELMYGKSSGVKPDTVKEVKKGDPKKKVSFTFKFGINSPKKSPTVKGNSSSIL